MQVLLDAWEENELDEADKEEWKSQIEDMKNGVAY